MVKKKLVLKKALIMKITSYVERDPESGKYIALVPSIPGAHTQADSLDELKGYRPRCKAAA